MIGSNIVLQTILRCETGRPPIITLVHPEFEDLDEQKLLEYFQMGSREQREDAFLALFKRHYSRVWGYISKKGVPQDEVDSISSDVWQIAFEKLPSYIWQDRPLISWLCETADNKIKEHNRKAYPADFISLDAIFDFLESDPSLSTPDEVAFTETQRKAKQLLAKALSQLKDRQREVLVLTHFHNMTSAEIGERLNETPGNIRQIRLRAVNKLRKILENEHNNGVK